MTMTNIHSRETTIPQPRANHDAPLEMKFSEDSSVFSGLMDQENEMNDMNQMRPPMEIRQPKGILRASSHAGPMYDISNGSREHNQLFAQSGSSLTDRSERSILRDMPPMVDSSSTFTTESPNRREAGSIRERETNTQKTRSEANDVMRRKGSVKLVSSVRFSGHKTVENDKNLEFQNIDECRSSDSDSRIVEMLDDFERQMDANIRSLSEDADENDVLTDFNKNIVSQNFDIQSQEPEGHFLEPQKAKKLERILQMARKEVEVLRDHNEQYKSEIEQMEEEHKSEIKLVEDRAKQKLVELKNMYQHEIDNLMHEKDAAVVEAGRVAARYAETGKKQVSTMQKQVDKLKAVAAMTIREKIKQERETTTTNKDKEIAEKLESLRKSHQIELERVKKESEERLKIEVEKTASSVAKRVRLNQDVLVSELTTQIDEFRKQRHSVIEVLKSVKMKFAKHYPQQMVEFNERSLEVSEIAHKALEQDDASDRGIEKPLKEVIEIFSFLLEDVETKAALVKEQAEIEENNKDSRKMLVLRHREEIESLQREKEEKDEKLRKLEEDFKALSQEKCLLHEKYQRESESQKMRLERISTEKETFMSIERSRQDLEQAMAEGQRELSNAMAEGQRALAFEREKAENERLAFGRPADQRTSLDIPPTPPTPSNEPASIRKARTFQKKHPKLFPRYSSNSRNQTPNKVNGNDEPSDCRSVTSNCSVQSNGTLSDLRSQVREAEDQVIDIINTMTDSSTKSGYSADNSMRSKATILSNFRNQSKQTKVHDEEELKEQDHFQDKKNSSKLSSEEKMKLSKIRADGAPIRKKLAILRRNVQTDKDSNQLVRNEMKEKKKNSDVLRQPGVFKQYIEERQDDSSFRSLDESISSLQTNNGVKSRKYKSSTVACSDSNQIIQNLSHQEPACTERGTNTLGMFSQGKQHENEIEQESMMSEIVSENESKDSAHILNSKRLYNSAHENVQTFGKEEGASFSTHLNFKKPPLSLGESTKSGDLSGKKDNVTTDVLSGKKGDPPSSIPFTSKSAPRSESIDSGSQNSIPSSIAVRPPANKSITAVANGHTLLCKPLSLQQSKIYPQETISNLSGGTVSSNDDDEPVYESHVQMRKMPPLTDDSDDDESRMEVRDKYQSAGSNASHDNSSKVEKKSVSIVETKKSTHRRLGLAAFKPSKSQESSVTSNTYDSNSMTGSGVSEATTTVTAHTRKSLSFLLDPRRSRSHASKQNLTSNKGTSSNGTKRFSSLKARVRVRKI